MPSGLTKRIYKKRLTKRIYKKRYKAALTRIADKIPAAFASNADRKRWISEVTNLRMQDMRGKRNDQD